MADRLEFWRQLAAALGSGEPVFLAVVAHSTAHSPGTAGASLFTTADGRQVGTVGGGAMELRLLERAWGVLRAGKSLCEYVDLHHRRDVDGGERSGMICSGRQTNLYCTLGAADRPAVEAWLEALSTEQGGLCIDADGLRVLDEAPANPGFKRGDRWRFEESALERRRLAILGGGHCGQALGQLMGGLGWRVRLYETRGAILDAASFDLDIRRVEDFRDAGALIDHPPLTPVVVMTTDVPNDVRALAGALGQPFPLVGAMGSAAKLDEIRRRLVALGFQGPDLERLTAPVGLEIDSHTPLEIAVSVAGQLLARRHEWLEPADASKGELDG